MANGDEVAFFREGLRRYADASKTVGYFQASAHQYLESALKAKASWRFFEPTVSEGQRVFTRGTAPEYIYDAIAGTIPARGIAKAWLGLGLYWNVLARGNRPVVAAASCWVDGSSAHVPFSGPASDSSLSLGPVFKKNERRLLLFPDGDFEPEQSFGMLLDAADELLRP